MNPKECRVCLGECSARIHAATMRLRARNAARRAVSGLSVDTSNKMPARVLVEVPGEVDHSGDRRFGSTPANKIVDLTAESVRLLRAKGMSVQAIAKQLKCSRYTVTGRLREDRINAARMVQQEEVPA